MRFIKRILASAAVLLTTGTALLAAQDPTIKVDVHTNEGHTVWYTDPKWLAIGGIVVLLVIILAIMAARGRDKSTTTVVR